MINIVDKLFFFFDNDTMCDYKYLILLISNINLSMIGNQFNLKFFFYLF